MARRGRAAHRPRRDARDRPAPPRPERDESRARAARVLPARTTPATPSSTRRPRSACRSRPNSQARSGSSSGSASVAPLRSSSTSTSTGSASSGAWASRPSDCRSAACRACAARASERDIDVLFLGGDTVRRGAVLSTLGPLLWNRRADLRLFRFTEPVHGGVPGLVFGQDKYDLLARTRMLVNVHRDDSSPGYFEWARMIEAMANGVDRDHRAVDGVRAARARRALRPDRRHRRCRLGAARRRAAAARDRRSRAAGGARRRSVDRLARAGARPARRVGPRQTERRVSAAGSGATASLGCTVAR